MDAPRSDDYPSRISNTGKVFFPESGITKGDLVEYYRRVSPVMIPHMEGRPISMERYPDGIGEEGFFQKEAPEYFPEWVHRVTVEVDENGMRQQVVCGDARTLLYLADQGCITPHTWLSREVNLYTPDTFIFDLDPAGRDFGPVKEAAFRIREILEGLQLRPCVMTTGSRGIHVTVPILPSLDFKAVRTFAKAVAGVLARRYPDTLTTDIRKEKRKGRLFIDVLRNAYGSTSVPPYAVRAKPGAPVATPLDWAELEDPDIHSQRYTIRNIPLRLDRMDDPWKGRFNNSKSLDTVIRRLKEKKQA